MPPTTPGHDRWALALCLLICALPLLLMGCKAPYAPSAPEDAYYEESYGSGGYDYDYADEGAYEQDYRSDGATMAEAPPPEPEPIADSAPAKVSRGRMAKKQKGDFGRAKERRKVEVRETSTTSADPGASPRNESEPLEVEAPDAGEAPAASTKRQIIYTATMQVSVYDLPGALEVIESLPQRYGGWLHQRIDNQVVLRIPAEQLELAMATVAELGVVDYRLLEALDVTAEYTDLESRMRVLAEMQKHLRALLAKAVSVEQALEIRRALDSVTLELEAARARMRELAKSIAFSTLILRLVERGPTQELPSTNDPFPWVDELGAEATEFR